MEIYYFAKIQNYLIHSLNHSSLIAKNSIPDFESLFKITPI
jgi:hypothetical protein